MKMITWFLASMMATNVYAGLPDGTFKGRGLWKSPKEQGTYEVTTSKNRSNIAASYLLSDGTKKEWKFEMVPSSNGFFKVKVYGAEVGKGYCLDQVEVCHYEIKVGSLILEETLTVLDGKLYRFGSKEEGSVRIMWQESMDKK